MKNARWKICKRNTSGFTLVEVIVTLVILSILLTGAVMGIASWNRNSIYKRNNEYAQTLFIAAQTALAQEAAAGNSGELLAYVENGGAGSGLVQGYDAVSYTHLDVYKRQLSGFLLLLDLVRTEKQSNGDNGQDDDPAPQ